MNLGKIILPITMLTFRKIDESQPTDAANEKQCNGGKLFSWLNNSVLGSWNPDLEKALLREFKRLDDYLNTPLPEEIDQDSTEELMVSRRKFLDGDWMTLADCNLLPKLNIIKVSTCDQYITLGVDLNVLQGARGTSRSPRP